MPSPRADDSCRIHFHSSHCGRRPPRIRSSAPGRASPTWGHRCRWTHEWAAGAHGRSTNYRVRGLLPRGTCPCARHPHVNWPVHRVASSGLSPGRLNESRGLRSIAEQTPTSILVRTAAVGRLRATTVAGSRVVRAICVDHQRLGPALFPSLQRVTLRHRARRLAEALCGARPESPAKIDLAGRKRYNRAAWARGVSSATVLCSFVHIGAALACFC
jgi:hypothetical protein